MPLRNPRVFIVIGFAVLVIVAILLATGVIPGVRKNIRAVSLTMWGFDEGRVWEPIIRQYHVANPGIAIAYKQLSPATYEQDLINGLATGKGPDIFMVQNTWLPKHGDKLRGAPANSIAPAQVEALFPPAVMQDFVSSGAVYALPLYMDTLSLIYNKDAFDARGIPLPPSNWLDFQELARKLGKGSAAIGGSSRTILHASDLLALFMMQFGAPMNGAAGRADFKNGEGAVSFYTKFGNPESSYYVWNNQLPRDSERFATGRLPMIFGYYADVQAFRAMRLGFRVGVAPMLQPAGMQVNYPSYAGMGVWAQSAHPEEAWRFIVVTTATPELALAYAKLKDAPPALRALGEEFRNDPDRAVFARQALTARSWFQPDSAAVSGILSDMVESIQANALDAKTALARAEEAINRIIDGKR